MNTKLKIVIACAVAVLLLLAILIVMRSCGEETNIPGNESTQKGKQTESNGTTWGTEDTRGQNVEEWNETVNNGSESSQPSETTMGTDPSVSTTPSTRPNGTEPVVTTSPTNPSNNTEPSTQPTNPTEPSTQPGPTAPSTQPTEPTTPSTQPSDPTEPENTIPGTTDAPSHEYTYEDYMAMSPSERQAFVESFGSIDAFWEWYDAAYADYEARQETIEVGGDGGGIDIGDLVGGGDDED